HGAGPYVADRFHEVRLVGHAVARNRRDRMRELNRRERVVPLADAGRDAVAQVPLPMLFAVVLPGEALTLPVARRKHAGKLALDVDPGLAAEPELRQKPERVVDVGLAREHVVIRVAGDDDRLVHVDAAMAARLVVVEAVRRAR